MRNGRGWTREIAISPQFLAIEPHFVRKGCDWTREIAISPQFLAIELHFVRKGCDWTLEIAILRQFLAIEPHFMRKGCNWTLENRNFTSVFGDRTSFRAKGLRGTCWNRDFTSVFSDRTSFRAKGLRFVPSRWHCPCPRLQKRNRKEGEGKRARGQEEKMWRCEDVKMWRCEDEKMWRWADVKMWRCEDEQMWRWEDVKMWRWEDERQTPTIGRTLRSDALGKKGSLAHGKTWFGRRFCCLVIYANLHRLPCICIKMVPTGIFSTFLLTVGITVEKGSFEHGKTWFKWFRRVFVTFLVIRTSQNMVWRVFLLFGDLC